MQPAVPEEPPLAAVELGKRYGRRGWALQAVDLRIRAGKVTGLVGPNGAGKSTLMRTWMGFERPSTGRATVLGRDVVHNARDIPALVGYVPQSPSFHDGFTVLDHVVLVALLRRVFDRELALARLSGLGIDAAAPVKSLSGGQRAQLALALALATGAPILLLDEPLADLDPLARREFVRMLRTEIEGSNRTVVLSSHVVSDVVEACERLVVLGRGRVVLDDAIADVVSHHEVAIDQTIPDGIASFLGPAGETLTLRRRGGDRPPRGLREATLEEVVLGYLSAARADGVPPGA